MPPTQPSLPVFYSVSGSDPQPVPSTGMFSSLGKQSTATSREEAVAKAKASSLSIPGKQIWGADKKDYGYLVKYQNGGIRRKSRRGVSRTKSGRKTRKNKSRRK
jgi:hypothetical protein